eukprot:COSAG03_NODE_56_length_15957_cov_538.173225_2_plen_137_part_00
MIGAWRIPGRRWSAGRRFRVGGIALRVFRVPWPRLHCPSSSTLQQPPHRAVGVWLRHKVLRERHTLLPRAAPPRRTYHERAWPNEPTFREKLRDGTVLRGVVRVPVPRRSTVLINSLSVKKVHSVHTIRTNKKKPS